MRHSFMIPFSSGVTDCVILHFGLGCYILDHCSIPFTRLYCIHLSTALDALKSYNNRGNLAEIVITEDNVITPL